MTEPTEHVSITGVVPTPIAQQKAWYIFKYTETGNVWTGERLGLSSKEALLSLINKWEESPNIKGFFVGEVAKGNIYPEIPTYAEASALYKEQTIAELALFNEQLTPTKTKTRGKK